MKSNINIICLLLVGLISSCEKKQTINELYFIGDSHIARWDVANSFPEYITYNMGVSGSKLDYIEQYAGYFKGKLVIVIIGTNDFTAANNKFNDYIIRYCNALTGLEANHIYVYSIFPNNNIENTWNIDNKVLLERVNKALKNYIQYNCKNIEYIDVYEDLLFNGLLNPEYYSDGLHLNNNGYELITHKLKKNL